MRLFVAADLPAALRGALASVQEEMAAASLPVRWVPPEGIHLTLKFLGEVGEERLPEIRAALRGAGEEIAPFALEAAGASVFPARGAPRLIWVEVRGDLDAARGLAASIDAALARLGLFTARVIVPGFQPIHFGWKETRLGGTRLFDLAHRLGLRSRPATPADLNDDPHPLA